MKTNSPPALRLCLREPIPEIQDAAEALQMAVKAHLAGERAHAAQLIDKANDPVVRAWTESIWGKSGEYAVSGRFDSVPAFIPGAKARMPTLGIQRDLHQRDGYYCRFCGIPVIRKQIRERLRKEYPKVQVWGTKNCQQHAALQCMWAQYDHLLPHSRGGDNCPDNLVVTCAPCNYGRMQYTLEEAGLQNPLRREPKVGPWSGLENLLSAQHAA